MSQHATIVATKLVSHHKRLRTIDVRTHSMPSLLQFQHFFAVCVPKITCLRTPPFVDTVPLLRHVDRTKIEEIKILCTDNQIVSEAESLVQWLAKGLPAIKRLSLSLHDPNLFIVAMMAISLKSTNIEYLEIEGSTGLHHPHFRRLLSTVCAANAKTLRLIVFMDDADLEAWEVIPGLLGLNLNQAIPDANNLDTTCREKFGVDLASLRTDWATLWDSCVQDWGGQYPAVAVDSLDQLFEYCYPTIQREVARALMAIHTVGFTRPEVSSFLARKALTWIPLVTSDVQEDFVDVMHFLHSFFTIGSEEQQTILDYLRTVGAEKRLSSRKGKPYPQPRAADFS
jgi:hypothetical protein